MVRRIRSDVQTIFQCELCDFGYADIETAEACEEYCNTHNSCSREITQKAVYKPTQS